MYICFLDFANAYDTISREALWAALRYHHVPDDMIDFLKSYYNETRSFVKMGRYWLQEPIVTNLGVRQGCPLSPLLFNVVLNELINKVSERCNIARSEYLTPESSGILAYADDLVVWAPTETALDDLINTVIAQGFKIGLQLNLAKCAIMARDGEKNPEFISTKILYVTEYKYLGIRVTNESRASFLSTDMNHRLGPLFRAAKENVKKSLSFNKGSLHLRTQLATALVISKMTYGYELWPNSKVSQDLLRKNMAILSSHLLGIRTISPAFKVVVWEAGLADQELAKQLRQVELGIYWRHELLDTPIHQIMLTTDLYDPDKRLWTTYALKDVDILNNVELVAMQNAESTTSNARTGELDALDVWKKGILDSVTEHYMAHLLTASPTSTEFMYMEMNGTRLEYMSCLRRMVEHPYGRRCLHEFRCGCYPTMKYRRETGWKTIAECTECPFCKSGEEESVGHLLWLCSSWEKLRDHFLGEYEAYGEAMMTKIVLGHRYSIQEQAVVDRTNWQESDIVMNIVCFLQQVDKRRSAHLKNLGWDITSRRSASRGVGSWNGQAF